MDAKVDVLIVPIKESLAVPIVWNDLLEILFPGREHYFRHAVDERALEFGICSLDHLLG